MIVCFVSLIVKSYMLNHVKGMTQKKLLLELDKIKVFRLYENSKPKLINPVSKTARDIFLSLDISQELCMC